MGDRGGTRNTGDDTGGSGTGDRGRTRDTVEWDRD